MSTAIGSRSIGPDNEHPRITALRYQVYSLPVDPQYRAQLLKSIKKYADQIIARPQYAPNEGWDGLEALQQVTLGDMMERSLQELLNR